MLHRIYIEAEESLRNLGGKLQPMTRFNYDHNYIIAEQF